MWTRISPGATTHRRRSVNAPGTENPRAGPGLGSRARRGIGLVTRRVLPTAEAAGQECARHILVRLEDALAAGAPATLAISGGSSPKPMFEYFARVDFDWSKVD